MHFHCEIILPPDTTDINSAIESVMAQFDENQPEDEDHDTRHSFWDFYVIGGRWAGTKLMAKYDQVKIDEFHKWMESEKITVSGLRSGKQELNPATQIPKVDAKWNEMFPAEDGVFVSCPMFNHSNDQYGRNGNGTIVGDICKLGEAKNIECSRIIFAGNSFSSETSDYTGKLEAKFMLSEDFWNGCNHVKSNWDGKVSTAVDIYVGSMKNYKDEYRDRHIPTDDWIMVTVDYHS